jgi:fructoselysine 6-kinase
MKIAVIGDNCIDVYLPPVNEEYVGGCAVNVAIHLANNGFKVCYMGVVGSDLSSDTIWQSLNHRGIDTTNLLKVKGACGITETKITNGQKTIVREDLGAQLEYATSHVFDKNQLRFLSGFDYIYYTGFTSWQFISQKAKEKIKKIIIKNLTLLRGLNNKIIFDYGENKLTDLMEKTAGLVDYAFFSLADLDKEDAIKFAKNIIDSGAMLAGITLGSKGAVIADKKEVLYFPTSDIKVVDTLGAGDTFIGTFMARFILGDSLKVSGKKATNAAENTCLQVGGWGVSI